MPPLKMNSQFLEHSTLVCDLLSQSNSVDTRSSTVVKLSALFEKDKKLMEEYLRHHLGFDGTIALVKEMCHFIAKETLPSNPL